MRTIKNGDKGTIETIDHSVWSEAEDLQYYEDIHGNDEGTEDRRRFMIRQIEVNIVDYIVTLDRAIRFLWSKSHVLDDDTLSLLSVEGKIALLRQLIVEQSSEIPISERMAYINRFEDDFKTYVQTQELRDEALRRYLLVPNGVWLRELVEADDATVNAWYGLQESMSCEHEGFERPSVSRCG